MLREDIELLPLELAAKWTEDQARDAPNLAANRCQRWRRRRQKEAAGGGEVAEARPLPRK